MPDEMPTWVGHQDKNGVGWRIFAIPAVDGVDVYGTMDQTGKRVYDPEPTDVGPIRVYNAGEPAGPSAARIDAARQQLYARIAADVANRTPVNSIIVTAKRDTPWWVWVLGALAAAKYLRR